MGFINIKNVKKYIKYLNFVVSCDIINKKYKSKINERQ